VRFSGPSQTQSKTMFDFAEDSGPQSAREAFESREAGRSLLIADDIQFLLDGLKPAHNSGVRALSALKLARECLSPDTRMHLRAHNLVASILGSLSDAAQTHALALTTACLLYLLAKDSLGADTEHVCVPLLVDLAHPNSPCNLPMKKANKQHDRLAAQVRTLIATRRSSERLCTLSPRLLAMEACCAVMTQVCVCVCVDVCVWRYVCVCVCVDVYIYIYIYIYMSARGYVDILSGSVCLKFKALCLASPLIPHQVQRSSFRAELRVCGLLDDAVAAIQKHASSTVSVRTKNTHKTDKRHGEKASATTKNVKRTKRDGVARSTQPKSQSQSATAGSEEEADGADTDDQEDGEEAGADIEQYALADLDALLRLLQAALFLDPTNQEYLVHHRDSQLLTQLTALVGTLCEHFEEESCGDDGAASGPSLVLADCLLGTVRVLLGLTHENQSACESISSSAAFTTRVVSLCANSGALLPEDVRHDGLVLVLSLLVNLVEHSPGNATQIVTACMDSSLWETLETLFTSGAHDNSERSGEEGETHQETSQGIVAAYTAILAAFLCHGHLDHQSALQRCYAGPGNVFSEMATHVRLFDAYCRSAGLAAADLARVVHMLRVLSGEADDSQRSAASILSQRSGSQSQPLSLQARFSQSYSQEM
jgi:hypothetical protein